MDLESGPIYGRHVRGRLVTLPLRRISRVLSLALMG